MEQGLPYVAAETPCERRRGGSGGLVVDVSMTACADDSANGDAHTVVAPIAISPTLPRIDASAVAASVSRVAFHYSDDAFSDRSSRISRSEIGRAVARAYEPSVRERVQEFLEGGSGFRVELLNLLFSVLIFALYILELYNVRVAEATLQRSFELSIACFFAMDLLLHLFVSARPWHDLFSANGIIDLLTIIPSFLVFFIKNDRSQAFFILRVLRIFGALRVLRLRRFLSFKKDGFYYELSVFLLSSVAVIVCAAGLFHAIEEQYYINRGESFMFHDALYFILVTISTIGYGDVSPQTALGKVFVMLLIIGIITVVPQRAAKLTNLAKQNHTYDKNYKRRGGSTAHVIVSGCELTAACVLDFLEEFYHSSRGHIQLDVVFMGEAPPSSELTRLLASDPYARRTRYLRGSLANSSDQQRARLPEAAAVFFLSNKLLRRDVAKQDAMTLLHTLAVRNFADSYGMHLDVYLQLRSPEHEFEKAALLLGANATNTSDLRTMLLARAAICPGATTFILNLLQSVTPRDYNKTNKWPKPWVEEYVEGMSYQIFPIIFSKRFQYEPFDDAVRNIYERYNALLIMVSPRRIKRGNTLDRNEEHELKIAPFRSFLREGDIGIVMAKSAATVVYIVNSYGYWRDGQGQSPLPRPGRPVRVSSDSLMKRLSPRHRQRVGSFVSSPSPFSDPSPLANGRESWSLSNLRLGLASPSSMTWGAVRPAEVSSDSQHQQFVASPITSSNTMAIHQAIEAKQLAEVEALLRQDHFVTDVKDLKSHFVICAGRLRDALSIVAYVKRFSGAERQFRKSVARMSYVASPPRLAEQPTCVLLVESLPSASDLVAIMHDRAEDGEFVPNLLQKVLFIKGSSTKRSDLANAAIQDAQSVVVLRSQTFSAKIKIKLADTEAFKSTERENLSIESLTDFGVINSLLVAEVLRDEQILRACGKRSPRRRQSSRMSTHESVSNSSCVAYYRQQLDQGLPLESINLRMLERYPDLEPTVFSNERGAIECELRLYDENHDKLDESGVEDGSPMDLDDLNTIAVLHHARSAKFSRPRDSAVRQDEHPCLAPSFASGNIFLSSILDRVICQAFYNPYITDVVRALAIGDEPSGQNGNEAPRRRPKRLFQATVSPLYAGSPFLRLFLDYLSKELLVVGILRGPNATLENLRPVVYTCPAPEAILHRNDRLFVLG